MSWGVVSATSVAKSGAADTLAQAAKNYEAHLKESDYDLDAEASAALAAAQDAAVALINSGALGDGPFNVNLSGHANPGNVPQSVGDASDTVAISVTSCARYSAPAETPSASTPSTPSSSPASTPPSQI